MLDKALPVFRWNRASQGSVAKRRTGRGPAHAIQPARIEETVQKIRGSRGQGGLVLLARGWSEAHVESSQQQCHADRARSAVAAERTGRAFLEVDSQRTEMLESPERRVRPRRIRVIEHRIWERRAAPSGRIGEVATVEMPGHASCLRGAIQEQAVERVAVRLHIAESLRIDAGKLRGSQIALEAVQLDQPRRIRKRLDGCDRIGGSAQADIPHDKGRSFLGCGTFSQALPSDVNFLRLRLRSDAGVKRFAFLQRTQRARPRRGEDQFKWQEIGAMHVWRTLCGAFAKVCASLLIRAFLKVNSIHHQRLNLPLEAPVMVLPGALLFPNALLPLHIFEPRYRKMLALALERDRMFCLASPQPGITEPEHPQDLRPVACLGLVRACVGKPDGTSDLVLQGLDGVRFRGLLQEEPFRVALIQEVPSIEVDSQETAAVARRLIELCRQIQVGEPADRETLHQQLAQISEPALLSDVVAHTFLRQSENRERALATSSVDDRIRFVFEALRAELAGG